MEFVAAKKDVAVAKAAFDVQRKQLKKDLDDQKLETDQAKCIAMKSDAGFKKEKIFHEQLEDQINVLTIDLKKTSNNLEIRSKELEKVSDDPKQSEHREKVIADDRARLWQDTNKVNRVKSVALEAKETELIVARQEIETLRPQSTKTERNIEAEAKAEVGQLSLNAVKVILANN